MVKYVIVGKCSRRGEGGSNENYNLNKHRNTHFFIANNCSPPPPPSYTRFRWSTEPTISRNLVLFLELACNLFVGAPLSREDPLAY